MRPLLALILTVVLAVVVSLSLGADVDHVSQLPSCDAASVGVYALEMEPAPGAYLLWAPDVEHLSYQEPVAMILTFDPRHRPALVDGQLIEDTELLTPREHVRPNAFNGQAVFGAGVRFGPA